MKPLFFVLVPLMLILAMPLSAVAGMYKYVDDDGNVHFTDRPPEGVKARKMKMRKQMIEAPTYGGGAESAAGEDREGTVRKRPYSDIKVKLYMTSWCPYCRDARAYIKSLGVSLIQYDIEKNPGKKQAMLNMGYGKSVPKIDVEGIIISGYVPSAIKDAVEKKRLE